MNQTVSYRLSAVNCQPNQYYFADNQTVCLVCGSANACFGFFRVDLGAEGIKMNANQQIIYLTGNYDNFTALHFYSYGIDKILNCNELLVCKDGIVARVENNSAIFTFPNNFTANDIYDEIKSIATSLGYDQTCQYIQNILVTCGKLVINWRGENEISFIRD